MPARRITSEYMSKEFLVPVQGPAPEMIDLTPSAARPGRALYTNGCGLELFGGRYLPLIVARETQCPDGIADGDVDMVDPAPASRRAVCRSLPQTRRAIRPQSPGRPVRIRRPVRRRPTLSRAVSATAPFSTAEIRNRSSTYSDRCARPTSVSSGNRAVFQDGDNAELGIMVVQPVDDLRAACRRVSFDRRQAARHAVSRCCRGDNRREDHQASFRSARAGRHSNRPFLPWLRGAFAAYPPSCRASHCPA